MIRSSVLPALSLSLLALAGCGTSPLVISRPDAAVSVAQPKSASAVSRKFRAEAPYMVNFDHDSAQLPTEARVILDAQANWIIDHPQVQVRVYGHADLTGSNAYNENLGQRRADAVVAYLVSQGIDADRIEAVISFGEDFPMVANDAKERLNRRVLTDVSGYIPPVEREDAEREAPVQTARFVDTVPQTNSDETDQPEQPPTN